MPPHTDILEEIPALEVAVKQFQQPQESRSNCDQPLQPPFPSVTNFLAMAVPHHMIILLARRAFQASWNIARRLLLYSTL